MQVLLIDENSMMDIVCWETIKSILEVIGNMSILLFGDLKQLPPATSRAPFVVDPQVPLEFKFRVLRQNRRIINDPDRKEELD
eukprot:1174834-Karenia_brevis.AAC.1